jgi:uncharacterized protein YjbI with pentapeptide repeats
MRVPRSLFSWKSRASLHWSPGRSVRGPHAVLASVMLMLIFGATPSTALAVECASGPDAQCVGADLRGASLGGEDLVGADFSRADVRGVSFTDATLGDARFTRARANGANFGNAFLERTDFTRARLKGSEFFGAYITRVTFTGAILTDVDLRGIQTDGMAGRRAQAFADGSLATSADPGSP